MTADDRVPICPACESADIRHRVRGDRTWYCSQCGHDFAIPDDRERVERDEKYGVSGLARVLLDTDPDDVGGE
jgi:ribosomal protein L37AE/L43A